MCGIIGYIGHKPALPILVQGLKKLEYRGYDSAGAAVINRGRIVRVRAVGKINRLEEKTGNKRWSGTIGLGHTRWATHGGVTEKNAHPHFSCSRRIVIVHNGIIENYRELKKQMGAKYRYSSETDTEILANLIDHFYDGGHLLTAVKKALRKVRGTYGLVVMSSQEPRLLVAARLGSPMVVGLSEGEQYLASDAAPLLPYTQRMIFLDDGDIAEITENGAAVHGLHNGRIDKKIAKIPYTAKEAVKQHYRNFMLKEIFEQAEVFKDAVRGRIHTEEGTAKLGGLNMTEPGMRKIKRVVFTACGTAWHASMIGKYLFERFARIPAEADIASEFRYRSPVIDNRTLVFAVSQSGETADTLAAIREAKRRGAQARGIINVVGSTIAREVDGGTYIHAGPELAVASTKAYTNMVAVMLLYALSFGRLRGLDMAEGRAILEDMETIPLKMKKIFKLNDAIKNIARKYCRYRDFLFLGRGLNYPVALEGSLKLKEISYIHSEGYAAGEMKHGANALLSPDCPVVAVATKNSFYEKMRSNIEEVKARHSKVIIVAAERDRKIGELADDVIYVPRTSECLEPILNTIPLQIFAYHAASLLGRDVDRPRNLAKSVTVE